MYQEVVNFAEAAFLSPLSWIGSLFSRTGMVGYFTAFFLVYQVTRLILLPLFGRKIPSAASDTVADAKAWRDDYISSRNHLDNRGRGL